MRNRNWFDILALAGLVIAGSVLSPAASPRDTTQASVVWGSDNHLPCASHAKGGLK